MKCRFTGIKELVPPNTCSNEAVTIFVDLEEPDKALEPLCATHHKEVEDWYDSGFITYAHKYINIPNNRKE